MSTFTGRIETIWPAPKIPYYEHSWSTRRQACLNKKVFACHPNRINANQLEKLVWEKIDGLLTDPGSPNRSSARQKKNMPLRRPSLKWTNRDISALLEEFYGTAVSATLIRKSGYFSSRLWLVAINRRYQSKSTRPLIRECVHDLNADKARCVVFGIEATSN